MMKAAPSISIGQRVPWKDLNYFLWIKLIIDPPHHTFVRSLVLMQIIIIALKKSLLRFSITSLLMKGIKTNKSYYCFVKSFCNLFIFDLIISNTLIIIVCCQQNVTEQQTINHHKTKGNISISLSTLFNSNKGWVSFKRMHDIWSH